jgi:prepilin-type processing-associated H-X9-DG protein
MACPDLVDWVDNHNNGNRGRRPISSLHPGGAQCAFADGSVKFVSQTVNRTVWQSRIACDRGFWKAPLTGG